MRALVISTGEMVTIYREQSVDRRGFISHRYVDWKRKEYDEKDLKFVHSVYTKDTDEGLAEIREYLLKDGAVDVHNEYETFYGVGFDRWLRKGLADIPCDIIVRDVNKWEGYPWSYDIILKK